MQRSKSVQRSGFTLIEMLVVVSLISILISLLLPALGKTRRKVEAGTCKSNLKNIYGATVAFATERGRRMPSARGWVGDRAGQGWWWFEIEIGRAHV